MTPKELSIKIVAGILKKPGVTYSKLEDHATKLGIPIGIFQNAMQLVHKNKSVQSKLKVGVLIYIEREAPKPKVDILAEWRKDNPYPYPVLCKACNGKLCKECFPFYDPEKDTIEKIKERLIMTRNEYKALSQGRTFIPRKKKYEYTK
jgi:hypothetical protein